MAGKYFSGPDFAAAPIMGPGCGNLSSGHINDTVGEGCWKVSGLPIIISERWMPNMAGFEVANFNYRVDSTLPPIPYRLGINGAIA